MDNRKKYSRKETEGIIGSSNMCEEDTHRKSPDLVEADDAKELGMRTLSNTQRDKLDDLLKNLTPEKMKISEAMVFCIEHSDAANEITKCIYESISNPSTLLLKKMSFLYLINDILHNCHIKVNASFYRKSFENRLMNIMKILCKTYREFEGQRRAEGFKVRVFKILKCWEDSSIYTRDFLHELRNAFLGVEEINDSMVGKFLELTVTMHLLPE